MLGRSLMMKASGATVTPFFLDTYPGAAAAYSLRQLRANYTNAVVRVRRSSDSAEQDFTSAQITNGTLLSFCGAGNGFVRTWYDQTANEFHATQTTPSIQPQIVSAGSLVIKGTMPSLQFNQSRLTNASITISTPGHYFVVCSRDSTTGGNADVIMDSFNNTRQTVINTGNTEPPLQTWIMSASAGTQLSTLTPSTTNLALISALFNSINSTFRTNGVLRASGNAGSDSLSGLSIGDLRGNPNPIVSGSYSLRGKISELVLYPTNQTASVIGIENNLNAYYTIF